jgi:hypothetical protein
MSWVSAIQAKFQAVTKSGGVAVAKVLLENFSPVREFCIDPQGCQKVNHP